MNTITRLLAVLFFFVHLIACDRAAENGPKPAPPTPIVAPAPSSGIHTIPTFQFKDDVAFAQFAMGLEPLSRMIDATGYVSTDQLTAHGTRVIGYRHTSASYYIWTLDPHTCIARAQPLDPSVPQTSARISGLSSAAWRTKAAPDGTWGYFVWPEGERQLRPELWRLPAKADEAPQKFHTFSTEEMKNSASPAISADGRWLLATIEGKPALFAVDAAAGKVTQVPLTLAEELRTTVAQRVHLQFVGGTTRLAITRISGFDKSVSGDQHELGIATLNVSDPAAATITHLHWLPGPPAESRGIMAMSPDDRLMLVYCFNSPTTAPADVWQLPADAIQPPTKLVALPQTADRSMPRAAWSRDSKKLAVAVDGTVHVFASHDLAKATPLQTESARWVSDGVAFTEDGSRVISMSGHGYVTTIPLDRPREIHAHIGGESQITWDVPRQAPAIEQWPALRVATSMKHPGGGAPSTLIADVFNDGTGLAQQVRATIEIAPPLIATAANEIFDLGTLHMGTIMQGLTVRRFLDLPSDPTLFGKARRFSLTVKSKFGFDPAPVHWLHLPAGSPSEAEYHALAKQIFEAASAALVKAHGVQWKPPELAAMEPYEFGFRVQFPRTVKYQNPFTMTPESLRVNRAVMQVSSKDDLMRHAQMMLYWYIPHELVHCADNRKGWATEFVANMLQPYLTARILDAMPQAAYSAQSMSYVYDRYVEVLRPHLSSEELARIERFIANNGEGAPPWDKSPGDVFYANTPAYVYFGARINQHSWSMKSNLEVLCKKYLPAKATEANDDE